MSTAHPFEDTQTTQTNNLPRLSHTQRSRLVRSTRKLAKILGDNPTPQVNRQSLISLPWKKSRESNIDDPEGSPILSIAKKLARAALDPLQIVYRRDPETNNEDIYGIKPSSGGMNTLSRGNSWPSMLVLQTVTSRDSESDGHYNPYVSSQVPSPAMSSFSKRPPSIISASASKSTLFLPVEWEKSKEEREISHRRKRVSKLARHLGERIPPDLMLPKPIFVKPNGGSQRRRRLLSARTPVPSIVSPLPVESPTSEQEMTLPLSYPSPMFDVPRPAVEETVEIFESAGYASDDIPLSQFSQKHLRLHGNFSAPLLHERPAQPPTNNFSGGIDYSDAISLEDRQPESRSVSPRRPESRLAFLRLRPTSPPPAPNVVLHRSERRQGWSGEWNAASMQDVISKLRDL